MSRGCNLKGVQPSFPIDQTELGGDAQNLRASTPFSSLPPPSELLAYAIQFAPTRAILTLLLTKLLHHRHASVSLIGRERPQPHLASPRRVSRTPLCSRVSETQSRKSPAAHPCRAVDGTSCSSDWPKSLTSCQSASLVTVMQTGKLRSHWYDCRSPGGLTAQFAVATARYTSTSGHRENLLFGQSPC